MRWEGTAMAEYIESEFNPCDECEYTHCNNCVLHEFAMKFAKQLNADVAPVVHGRWVQVICHVEFEDGFVDRLYECCSRCHEPNGRKTSDYCPNCGARMDGE